MNPEQTPLNSAIGGESTQPQFPEAIVKPAPSLTSGRGLVGLLWLLAVVSVLVSIGLFWWSRASSGSQIVIQFRNGHGIKPEDRLKHLGIDIGHVEQVELTDDLQSLSVYVRLIPQAESLAREGSKFWIVRPSVSLDSIQGLDTILGPKYLAVEPGPASARRQTRFQGFENPPNIVAKDGSLEIVLDATERRGLESGAPVMYRGFRVGQVLQVGLASDSRTVRARCAIDPEYRDLIRMDTKFWNRSGWRVDIGLSGLRIDADTLAQMLSGGVELATPTNPGPIVTTGHRFELYDKGDPDWGQWTPSLASGKNWNKPTLEIPSSQRIALRWRERSFGIPRSKQRLGWCLPLQDGTLLCLTSLAQPPASAIADSAQIEVAGVSFAPPSWGATSGTAKNGNEAAPERLLRFTPGVAIPSDVAKSSADLLSTSRPKQVCSVLVASQDSHYAIAIDQARLVDTPDGWNIDPTIAIDRDAHGLPVISADEHLVIGVLSTTDGKNSIRLFESSGR